MKTDKTHQQTKQKPKWIQQYLIKYILNQLM